MTVLFIILVAVLGVYGLGVVDAGVWHERRKQRVLELLKAGRSTGMRLRDRGAGHDVYLCLEELQAAGLVESVSVALTREALARRGGHPQRLYSLTVAGWATLAKKAEPRAPSTDEHSEHPDPGGDR